MPYQSIAQELKEMPEGIGSLPRRGEGSAGIFLEGGDHIYYQHEEEVVEEQQLHQVCSGNLPQEILMDIIGRVEATETTWPSRRQVTACASVCRSWREATREIVKPTELSGCITFPISLKQPGPRDSPIECFIERDPGTNTYRLYLGADPGEENVKFLLSARKFRRATSSEFVISLSANDFSPDNSSYVGKLRSNFLGTKFTVFDSQPPLDAALLSNNHTTRRFHSKQVSPRVPAGNYNIANISYDINFLRSRGPRRMQCRMYSIPVSSIQEGGTAPTPTAYAQPLEYFSALSLEKQKEPTVDLPATSLSEPSPPVQTLGMPLILKNKAPRWQEQLQCWCLNFRGRVSIASIKNFQLVAAIDPSHQIPPDEQEKVVLQFGKTDQDIFTMDYQYPLSAFQAFAICLTSFDTKPACE